MTFRRSAVSFPLATGTGRSMLQDADPAIFWALDYLEAVLLIHLGARVAELAQARIVDPVAATVPYDPVPFLQQAQYKFPLLALYRRTSTFNERTVAKRHEVGAVELLYVLPPLTASQAEKLVPMLHAAATVIDQCTVARADAAYTPQGGQPGDSPFDSGFANLEDFKFTDAAYGLVTGIDDLVFYALRMSGTLREIDVLDGAGLENAESFANTVGLQEGDDDPEEPADDTVVAEDLVTTT